MLDVLHLMGGRPASGRRPRGWADEWTDNKRLLETASLSYPQVPRGIDVEDVIEEAMPGLRSKHEIAGAKMANI